MKKFFGRIAVLTMTAMILAGCGSAPAAAPAAAEARGDDGLLDFDGALAGAARAVEAKAGQGTIIAVVRVDGATPEVSRFVKDELDVALDSGGKVKVVGRGEELQAVLDEQTLHLSGAVSDESAVSIGQLLGARVVVTGSFTGFDAFSQLRLKAIDVETGAYAATYSGMIRNSTVPR
jgi:curli biogenesis system outer membrane secretion channel CsgG